MIKLLLVVTLWSVSEASQNARISALKMRSPVAFRPGVVLQRPGYQRIVPGASRRAPYIVYRNIPPRYAIKHINSGPPRNILSPWRTTRLPVSGATAEYEFLRAATSPVIHADAVDIDKWVQSVLTLGAIHTIPAPNLSLSEKPIVVLDSSESSDGSDTSESPKPTYEVTEKYAEQPIYQPNPKIEPPVGFSKASTFSANELQNIMRNNAALQIAAEYGLPIHLSQPSVQQSSINPPQFSMQSFNVMPSHQELRGPEGFYIPPNAIYQQDPLFMHKIHNQMYQFPGIEFMPFTPDFQPQVQTQTPDTETPLYLLQNEQITKKAPSLFVPNDSHKNIVQRETKESMVASLIPQAFSVKNVSENVIDVDTTTVSKPQNFSVDLVSTVTQGPTTTVNDKIETSTDYQKILPIYYTQIDQNSGNVKANNLHREVKDMRTLTNDKEIKDDAAKDNFTTTVTTTTQRETKALIHENDKNSQVDDTSNLIASPFEKTAESVNVAYTLLRTNQNQSKINQDGEIFAGQLVEAKISEDQDFNKEKAIFAGRPPMRLFSVTEKRVSDSAPQRSVVKAKIPPKSKLTFDDKTGEPILRVYASYVDNPEQKEIVTAKLSNIKRKEVSRRQENVDWKIDTVKNSEKDEPIDLNMAQYGLKIKSRSDEYIPIFDDYEE